MLAHDGYQHLRGQFQVTLVETPRQGCGLLHQIRHFLKKFGIVRNAAVLLCGQLARARRDQRPAPSRIQHDAVGGHQAGIVVSMSQMNGVAITGAQTSTDPPGMQAGVAEVHHLIPEHGDQPADRTGEADVGRVPTHPFLKAQAGYQLRQGGSENDRSRPAHLANRGGDVALAGILDDAQISDVHPPALGKTDCRPSWRSIAIKGAISRRTLHLAFVIRLARSHAVSQHRQPARRAQHLNSLVMQA